MKDSSSENKVYSPDMQVYEFEGKTGLFGTIASIVVGPVRLIMRVLGNIMVLPTRLMLSYSEGLLIVSGILLFIGAIDIIVYGKWPLLVSQIPALILALRLRAKSILLTKTIDVKPEVQIDTKQVEELCNSAIAEFDAIIGKDDSDD